MKSIKKKWSCASHCKLHFQKVLGIMIVALAFLLTGNANAQESKTIKGVVRDATGEPLIGASVIEKGTNNGVITDVEGSFIPHRRNIIHCLYGLCHPRNQIGKTKKTR